jgi:hypothetical protein
MTNNASHKPSDEIWIRRWLAKTTFVFGLALGFLIGIIVALRSVP